MEPVIEGQVFWAWPFTQSIQASGKGIQVGAAEGRGVGEGADVGEGRGHQITSDEGRQ